MMILARAAFEPYYGDGLRQSAGYSRIQMGTEKGRCDEGYTQKRSDSFQPNLYAGQNYASPIGRAIRFG